MMYPCISNKNIAKKKKKDKNLQMLLKLRYFDFVLEKLSWMIVTLGLFFDIHCSVFYCQIYRELDLGKPSLRLLYVTPELVATAGFMSKITKLYTRGLLNLIAVDEVWILAIYTSRICAFIVANDVF